MRICQLSKCLVDIRSRLFDFWRGLLVISEKNILENDFERKKACKEILEKNDILHWKKISLMTYNAQKNSYTCYKSGKEKFLTQEVWKKSITFSITWWCSRLKFCLSRLKNEPIKDINGKRKVNGMLSFLWTNESFSLWNWLSFKEEFNLVLFYRADRSAWLVLNQPWQQGFWKKLEVHSVLYGQGKYFF